VIEIIGTNGKGEQVIVQIEGDKTTIKTQGFKGRSCQNATAMLELALGVKTSDTPTQELFQQPAGGQTVKTS
jgi:hypothetical protein